MKTKPKQDQSIDLNYPIGFYVEPKEEDSFYPYFIRNRGFPVFPKDGVNISPVFKHPYSHEELQGYLAGLRAENAKLACLLSIKKPMSADMIHDKFEELGFSNNSFQLRCFIEGVRWAEKYHGIQEGK